MITNFTATDITYYTNIDTQRWDSESSDHSFEIAEDYKNDSENEATGTRTGSPSSESEEYIPQNHKAKKRKRNVNERNAGNINKLRRKKARVVILV